MQAPPSAIQCGALAAEVRQSPLTAPQLTHGKSPGFESIIGPNSTPASIILLLSPKSIDIIVSSPPRFANCGGERAGLELTAKEPGGIHGSRQRYAACGGASKSHARIVRFVADQDDELPAGRLRSLQRAHD